MFRIGIGCDTHRLVEGRPLIIGGVSILSAFGAEGHSDADVLTHAIIDAILGALAEGDIGTHFPDHDPQWRNADSLQLLARVMWLVKERGYAVENVDAVIMLERPKLRPYVAAMREKLAAILGVSAERVSVKAKTGEGMDAVGEGRAISAQAVVLLMRNA
ncbi:2-C-methyl-D-erythritol 2,4-cyclodiphosphate synthase [Pyrinomonas methylaliphatogenes]|jgi:2-C-methyl-D-erythritol 2,4-cyclodiphosphate synthase|uniref:2-C-methyl-D-erythritol 2,4-cyclodiphosphate synthase n=1 Tax=Pyrinomonas methylaliphatogenes TaxID=454194 RepID=A0A0B6WXP3_9BACT|nr:2-C-methyl-D-erythritol 2,4-cyclodiphosphate synthase [Pyrinomonas methylaliphatogenes]MBX5478771.1 2-C-methyl-D-erythritol 2,4-cyclodiphosphate synthase [Pyrinomonas methylaliphatogenes]CDM65502.1 2-C-methyl-D-erythritol 2,4-cyclodiphosphate synthase [Pyrinomonas methylaliphatogenes]